MGLERLLPGRFAPQHLKNSEHKTGPQRRACHDVGGGAAPGCAGRNTRWRFCYSEGKGRIEQDYGEAAHWFHEAANQGDVNASYSLGICYANGQGVAQDPRVGGEMFSRGGGTGAIPARKSALASACKRGLVRGPVPEEGDIVVPPGGQRTPGTRPGKSVWPHVPAERPESAAQNQAEAVKMVSQVGGPGCAGSGLQSGQMLSSRAKE